MLAAWLSERGVSVQCWSMSVVEPRFGFDWPGLVERLSRYSWAILPSPGSVDVVMAQLAGHQLAWPASTGIALIGAGSQEVLADWLPHVPGLACAPQVQAPVETPDAQALVAHMQKAGLRGCTVAVLCRANAGAAWLTRFEQSGARVVLESVYESHACVPDGSAEVAEQWIAQQQACVFSITSIDAGARLAQWLRGLAGGTWLQQQPVLTQHPRVAQALLQHGWSRVEVYAPGQAALWQALVACGAARERV